MTESSDSMKAKGITMNWPKDDNGYAVFRTAPDDPSALDHQTPENFVSEWVSDAAALLPTVIDYKLPATVDGRDFRKDFTAESLSDVEGYILHLFPAGPDYTDPETQTTIVDLMRYIGEVILRAAGGQWEFRPEESQSGLPCIRFDGPAGELTGGAIDIFMLIDQTVSLRTGSNLQNALNRILENFGAAGPLRSSTVFALATPVTETGDPLDTWLSAMDDALAAWTAETPGTWDRSLESLDHLGELVLNRYASAADFDERHREPFLLGAVRYLGETAIQNGGGLWDYAFMQDFEGTATGTATESIFIVKRSTDKGSLSVLKPIRLLRTVARKQNPGWLRQNITSYVAARDS